MVSFKSPREEEIFSKSREYSQGETSRYEPNDRRIGVFDASLARMHEAYRLGREAFDYQRGRDGEGRDYGSSRIKIDDYGSPGGGIAPDFAGVRPKAIRV